ncbi:hypothetical protein ACVIWV_002786 [Bradyrhizobium diazoefficiens]|jgi:hypothetical protein|uniref:Uncharacterized protein n=1 Tax=Bradyrhizobium diazoefficiens TaxID=1355477 RepID=A0A0E4BXN8_9BRAD|nr:hypothetical protein NK6_9443 [Bradyrhizobium diazoefficiens]
MSPAHDGSLEGNVVAVATDRGHDFSKIPHIVLVAHA